MESAAELLFDFEETNQSCPCVKTSTSQNAALEALACRIEFATGRQTTELARQLHRDVTALVGRPNAGSESVDALYRLASGLTTRGYDVSIRNALGGGASDCFKSLRHEFLVVRGTGEFRGMEFIVEPALRQHFFIPHPSPEYEYVLSRTPDVFVGGSCRLVPVVQLLCALMADSFKRQDLPLPPWRREAAMLSKWLPSPARILDLAPCVAGSAAALPVPALPVRPPTRIKLNADESPHESPHVGCTPGAAMVPEGVSEGPQARLCNVSEEAPPPFGSVDCDGDDGLQFLSVLSWAPTRARAPAADVHSPLTAVVVGFDVSKQTAVNIGAAGRTGDGHGRDNSPSRSRCGGEDAVIQLPYPDTDECASPCHGRSAGDETGSFLLASEASGDSLVHVYDIPSLLGSPVGGFFARLASTSPSASFHQPARRRATGTGMLPCPCLGTGLLSARLLLEPLAGGATKAAPLSPPSQAATHPRLGAAAAPPHLPLPLPSSPSPAGPCPFTRLGPCVEIRPPAYPDAPAIHLVRLAGGLGDRDRSCSGAAQATEQLSQLARVPAEWLPWGLPY